MMFVGDEKRISRQKGLRTAVAANASIGIVVPVQFQIMAFTLRAFELLDPLLTMAGP